MLAIADYKKSFNGTLVLSITKLALDSGIYWIKGENGSGKSTLFKSIAGIIPFEGEISFNAISQKKHPLAYRRLINYAEAEPLYPGFLTAKDLIRFIGKTRGAPEEQQAFYMRKFGVEHFFEKPCETYSSGMVKKLSLAMAFFGRPGMIILDEPLITLDAHSREILLDLIRDTLDNGVTFLISSHQPLDNFTLPLSGEFTIRNKTIINA